MTVEALDHVNIVTADLDRAEAFYREVLALETRPAPPPLSHATARWMYAGDRAVLHLNSLDAPRRVERDLTPGPTGALHHVAFRCSGYEAVLARIAGLGLEHHRNEVTAIGLRQVFVADPEGVLLELNFFGG